MNRYQRTSRSFTLMEMLATVVVMGACMLLAGPLSMHLIYAVSGRPQTYDQLFMVSYLSDRIRTDLHGQAGEEAPVVQAVEAGRLLIGSAARTIEYRTDEKQIERLETRGGKTRMAGSWRIPYSLLTFSRQEGKAGAVLVELHWQLGRPGDRRTFARIWDVEIDVSARERPPSTRQGEDH